MCKLSNLLEVFPTLSLQDGKKKKKKTTTETLSVHERGRFSVDVCLVKVFFDM